MKRRILHFVALSVLALAFVACEEPEEDDKILAIQINKQELTLKVGESFQATASYIPTHLPAPEFSWSSSNSSVATISPLGIISALAEGTADIRVYLNETPDIESICKITVIKPDAMGLVLNKTALTLDEGNSEVLTYTMVPDNAAAIEVVWESSDSQVATVDANGKVSALREGSAIIKVAQVGKPSVSASCALTVAKVKATGIVLSANEGKLLPGAQVTLSYTLVPEGSVFLEPEWNSDNAEIATVSAEGVVTAHKPGSVKIKIGSKHAQFAQVSAVYQLTVDVPAVAEIILNKTSLFMEKDTEETLSYGHLPEFSVLRAVVWSSSHPEIASVDENGQVKALEEGKAVITVQDADNAAVKASCEVNVIPITVTEVLISQEELELKVGEQFTLSYSSLPTGSILTNASWKSLDESVAQVSQGGVVTAVGPGETQVLIASATYPDLKASCTVKVSSIEATGLSLNKTTSQLTVGESERLIPTIEPANTTNKNCSWESGNTAVATVDALGNVTALSEGSCVITVRLQNSSLSASCQYTIKRAPILAESITLDQTFLMMTAAQTVQLKVSYLPEEADAPSFRWSSSDPLIASVSDDGKVDLLRVGSCIIKVETTDGRLNALCAVIVSAKNNGWREPVLEFGATREHIRTTETRGYNALMSALSSEIAVFNGENAKIQYCVYYFESDKMAVSLLVINSSNATEAEQYYNERYVFISEDAGVRSYISLDGKTMVMLGNQNGADYGLPGTFYVAAYYPVQ